MDISNFLDKKGRLKVFPAKPGKRQAAMEFISSLFEKDKIYSEKEVNEILKSAHSFNDHVLLRRELIDRQLLFRTSDGKEYKK